MIEDGSWRKKRGWERSIYLLFIYFSRKYTTRSKKKKTKTKKDTGPEFQS